MSTVDVISWCMASRVLPHFLPLTLRLPLPLSFLLSLFSFYSSHLSPSSLSVAFFPLSHDGVSPSLWPGEAIQDSTKHITQPLSILLRLYIKTQHIYTAVSTGAATWGLRLSSPLTDRSVEIETVRQREGEAYSVVTVPDFSVRCINWGVGWWWREKGDV